MSDRVNIVDVTGKSEEEIKEIASKELNVGADAKEVSSQHDI